MGRSWQSPLLGALTIDYRGSRFVLGRTTENYAIWDTTSGGAPSLTFPISSEGWTEAWTTFRSWEPGEVSQGGQPAEWGPSPTASWVKGQPLALGPMRAGQILDGVFRLYRMYFGTFVPSVARLRTRNTACTGRITKATIGTNVPKYIRYRRNT
ncbi:MAG TPA: hypothetical protein VHH92_01845, partial [Actinomycetota bacterium]|nr:hypothetical protein [Actinomycetota bacterium]